MGPPWPCCDGQSAVMRLPTPNESELRALERRYVSWRKAGPLRLRYLKIMGVNALRDGEPRRSLLMQSFAKVAIHATPRSAFLRSLLCPERSTRTEAKL